MYSHITADQFTIVDGSVIHLPTGAEFTPTSRSADSMTVWTGMIERTTSDGRIFKYAEVLTAARSYWHGFIATRFPEVA